MDLRWLLRRWADLLDSRFVIPGTNIRFGIDPIVSVVPFIGQLASPMFAMLLLVQGVRQRVPKVILLRMLFNALADAIIGTVPVLGSVGDIFWRANTRNLSLLEHYAQPGRTPSRGDYAFVFGMAVLFGALIVIPILLALWLTSHLLGWLGLL